MSYSVDQIKDLVLFMKQNGVQGFKVGDIAVDFGFNAGKVLDEPEDLDLSAAAARIEALKEKHSHRSKEDEIADEMWST